MRKERLDSELGLLMFIFLISSYMFVDAIAFPSEAAFFPLLTSSIVLVFTSILILSNIFPEYFESYIDNTSSLTVSTETQTTNSDHQENIPDNESTFNQEQFSVSELYNSNPIFLVLATIGYSGLIYPLGFYIASPIFAFVYGVKYHLSRGQLIAITCLAFILPYIIGTYLGVNLWTGVMFE